MYFTQEGPWQNHNLQAISNYHFSVDSLEKFSNILLKQGWRYKNQSALTCPAVPATAKWLLYLHRWIFWIPNLGSSLYGSKQPTCKNKQDIWSSLLQRTWKSPQTGSGPTSAQLPLGALLSETLILTRGETFCIHHNLKPGPMFRSQWCQPFHIHLRSGKQLKTQRYQPYHVARMLNT